MRLTSLILAVLLLSLTIQVSGHKKNLRNNYHRPSNNNNDGQNYNSTNGGNNYNSTNGDNNYNFNNGGDNYDSNNGEDSITGNYDPNSMGDSTDSNPSTTYSGSNSGDDANSGYSGSASTTDNGSTDASATTTTSSGSDSSTATAAAPTSSGSDSSTATAAAPTDSSSSDFITQCLEYQNEFRTPLGIPSLTWSADLASGAASWAQSMASSNDLVHSHTAGLGENIAYRTMGSSNDLQLLMAQFTDEKQYFIPGCTFPDCTTGGEVGHYTQIVWKDTTEVGCGTATTGNDIYICCRFSPAGNIVGEQVY